MGVSRRKSAFHCMAVLAVFGVLFSAPASLAKPISKKDAQKYLQEGEYDLDGTSSSKTAKKHSKPSRKLASVRQKAQSKKVPARRPNAVSSKKKKIPQRYSATTHGRQAPKGKLNGSRSHRQKYTQKRPAPSRQSRPNSRYAKKRPETKKSSRRSYASSSKKKSPSKKNTRVATGHRPSKVPYARATPNERDMPFVSVPKSKVRKDPKMIVMEDPAAPTSRDPEGPSQVALHPDPHPLMQPPQTQNDNPQPVEAAPQPMQPQQANNPGVHEPDAFDLHSGSDPMRPAGPAPANAPAPVMAPVDVEQPPMDAPPAQ